MLSIKVEWFLDFSSDDDEKEEEDELSYKARNKNKKQQKRGEVRTDSEDLLKVGQLALKAMKLSVHKERKKTQGAGRSVKW